MQGHPDFLVALDNVMIRDHMSLFRDNYTGPKTRRNAVAFVNPPTIAVNDTLALQNLGIDTYHRRCHSIDKFNHLVIGPN
jgi:hypothetical protein